jgi:Iap family predicted aminopeptidase
LLRGCFILGAHYDSWERNAPGADDNASGTAGVMEAARVLSDYGSAYSLIFILFSHEEEGVMGSKYFVSTNKNIINMVGMINFDMISYEREGDDIDVAIGYNSISSDLKNTYINSLTTYVPGLLYKSYSYPECIDALWSDHSSFWDAGIPALKLIDEMMFDSVDFNPYIHSNSDTIGLSANSKISAELITKSAVATLMELDAKTTSVDNGVNDRQISISFSLSQNYPNPFNPTTMISFSILSKGFVSLKVFDLLGREMATIVSEELPANNYTRRWNANKMPSGIYYCRLQVGSFTETKKLVLLR